MENNQSISGNILGSGQAETDGAMLNEAFIETSDYKTLIEAHDRTFVVGRRGTGKSALFIRAKAKFASNPHLVLLAHKPEEYESIELQRLLAPLAPGEGPGELGGWLCIGHAGDFRRAVGSKLQHGEIFQLHSADVGDRDHSLWVRRLGDAGLAATGSARLPKHLRKTRDHCRACAWHYRVAANLTHAGAHPVH